jgi:hypothetical protein
MILWILAGIVIVLMFLWKSGTPRDRIQTLVQKCASYAVQAQQDTSPVQAMLHANYAAAYLDALKVVSSERQIQQVGSVNLGTFQTHVWNVQKSVTDKALEAVPELAGKVDLYLQSIANPQVDWASAGRVKDFSSHERIGKRERV